MGLLGRVASVAGFSNGRPWEPGTGLADLSGKVAIVTGGNTGLGYITVQELHKKGAKVYIACRSEERARDAIKRINEANPGAETRLVFLPFDLTDLDSAKKAAAHVEKEEERLDIVVCNAGIMAWPYELKNGVEVQFWNHLGHFALIHPLIPLLEKTADLPNASVRIVSLSSKGHELSPKPDFSSLEGANQQMKGTWARYGQSKLANILFAVGLQEHLNKPNIHVNACHPGVVATELTRGMSPSYGFFGKVGAAIWPYLTMSPFEGAKTQLYLAGSKEVEEKNFHGQYFVPIATPHTPSAYAQDRKLAQQLWKLSEDIVKNGVPA
ncbi:hypothetical protein JCM6882_005313 [Rhodosporidiobolus microsporus]